MGWLTAILALLKALWPFFREAIFGRASVQAWLKTNFFSLVWLLFVIAMFVVVLKLSSTIRDDQTQITSLTTNNKALQLSFTADEGKLLQYKNHPVVCPAKPPAPVKEPKPAKVEPPKAPPPAQPKPVDQDQDQDVLNLLKRIHSEEH